MWNAEKAYTRFKAEAAPVVAVQQLPFGYAALAIAASASCSNKTTPALSDTIG